jgi:hypothetical protein
VSMLHDDRRKRNIIQRRMYAACEQRIAYGEVVALSIERFQVVAFRCPPSRAASSDRYAKATRSSRHEDKRK